MPKLWLPINPNRTNQLVVREGGRERIIIIPYTGVPSYDAYLEEAEVEKTRDELRKMPPRAVCKLSKEEIGGALREYMDWLRRKRGND